MKHDSRYIQNEPTFLQYSKDALVHCFVSPSDFDCFYSGFPDNESKNEFLRVASFYLFLVKKGDWVTNVTGADTVTDYLTNSYKLVSIFALIDSLSEREHQDFFRWLCSYENTNNVFPITSKKTLEALFSKYYEVHGATNFCVVFFERLPACQQAELKEGIQVQGKPVCTVKRAVQVLYGLRSRFVHEGALLIQLSDRRVISTKKKVHLFDINLSKVAGLFEQALLRHFAEKHGIMLQQTGKSFAIAVR